jgi:hypothetical protein
MPSIFVRILLLVKLIEWTVWVLPAQTALSGNAARLGFYGYLLNNWSSSERDTAVTIRRSALKKQFSLSDSEAALWDRIMDTYAQRFAALVAQAKQERSAGLLRPAGPQRSELQRLRELKDDLIVELGNTLENDVSPQMRERLLSQIALTKRP